MRVLSGTLEVMRVGWTNPAAGGFAKIVDLFKVLILRCCGPHLDPVLTETLMYDLQMFFRVSVLQNFQCLFLNIGNTTVSLMSYIPEAAMKPMLKSRIPAAQ